MDISTSVRASGSCCKAIPSARPPIAYSGVGADRPPAPPDREVPGRPAVSESTFREAGKQARSEIEPISDVRGSRDFRLQLAENILVKFYHDVTGAEAQEIGDGSPVVAGLARKWHARDRRFQRPTVPSRAGCRPPDRQPIPRIRARPRHRPGGLPR